MLKWLAFALFAFTVLVLDIIATPAALRGATMLLGE